MVNYVENARCTGKEQSVHYCAHAQICGSIYLCAAATLRLVSHRYDEDILKC